HPSKLGTRESLVDGGQTSNSKTRRQGELRIVVGVQAPGVGGMEVTQSQADSAAVLLTESEVFGEEDARRNQQAGGGGKSGCWKVPELFQGRYHHPHHRREALHQTKERDRDAQLGSIG
ncbi:hypothetical protein CRG98_048151, partial [Punica granatum]